MQGALRYCLGAPGPLRALPRWPSSSSLSSSTSGDEEAHHQELFEDSQNLDDWIEGNLSRDDTRKSDIVRLGRTAAPLAFEGAEILQTIGGAFSTNVK